MKKLILIVSAVILLLSVFPLTALAAPDVGQITQHPDLSEKVEIIPGANLSKYYFFNWAYKGAYPVWTKAQTGAIDEIYDSSAYRSYWGAHTAGESINGYVQTSCLISFSSAYNISTTSQYVSISYQQMFAAYALVLRNGYPLSPNYTLFPYNLTEDEAYYATNFALQRLSAMFRNGSDNGANYGDNGTSQSKRVAQFAWNLEQSAKRILLNSNIFPELEVTYAPEMQIGMGTYEGYFVNDITVKVPAGQEVDLYSIFTGFQWVDWAGLPVSATADFGAMTTMPDGTKYVTGKVLIPMYACKGNEVIKFNVGGQAANIAYYVDIYNCFAPDGLQPFIIADPEGIFEDPAPINLTRTNHQFKVPLVYNLTADSVTTDKSAYEAEENGTVTAVVRNSGSASLSNVPVRLNVNPSSTFNIINPNMNIPYLAPGASTSVTWNIKSGALAADTTGTFTAIVDPDNNISETNESDNSKTCAAHVYRLKPDLIVESVLTNKEPGKVFEAGEIIVITATVRNVGKATAGTSILQLSQIAPDSMQLEGFDQSQAPLPNPTFDAAIVTLAPGAATSVTWRFVNPIRVEARNVDATATADVYNVVPELREDNNTNSIKLTLNPGKPDFTPVWQNVEQNQVFKAGYEAVISAKIRNIGKISSDRVNIRLHINGKNYSDVIDIPTSIPNYPTGFHSAGGNLSSFRVRMPELDGRYTMTVTADPTNIVDEEMEDNNIATIQIVVEKELTPPVIDVTDPKVEEEYTGTIMDPPDIPYKDTAVWEEIRKTGDKKYEVKTYYAKLSQKFVMKPGAYVERSETPNEIESGYGLEGSTITSMDTNYDRPSLIVGSQIVRTYYPETNYGNGYFIGYHEKLQLLAGGNDFSRKWIMKVNPTSVKGFSLHYTPKWFPDSTYHALSHAICSYTPAGQLTNVAINSDVKIVGDMYDRITSGNR